VLAHVVAQSASGDAPAFDIFSLLLPLALAFLIFTMFRRQRKTQQQVKEMRTQMEPGTEVMTQFGLYGTIVSIDQENNKAVLELSPGNLATVHTQALSKVVQQDTRTAGDPADDVDTVDGTTVPDDASSISGDITDRTDRLDRTPSAGSTASGATAAGSTGDPGVETPEETLARLNREAAAENRDARDPRDPRTNPEN
jgi:preprotein translocase subunit YajC